MTWLYKTIRLSIDFADYKSGEAQNVLNTLEALLTAAGQEGWELVSTLQTEASGYTQHVVAILKQPKT